MLMKIGLVFIVLFIFIPTAKAQDNSLLYFCCSAHRWEAENEQHHGILYERRIDNTRSIIFGTYQNSQDRRSILIGGKWEIELSENWDAFAVGGLVTGYGNVFGAMPGLEYKKRIQIYVIPGVVYGVGLRVLTW